jgi:hypothetical protein
MGPSTTVAVLCVCFVAAAACSEPDSRKARAEEDSGTPSDASTGGSAGADAGDASAGSGGVAGSSGGTGGAAGAEAGLVCPPVQIEAGAGDAASEAGDAAAAGLRWRDWSLNTCRSCPSLATVRCASFGGVPATIDLASGRASFVLSGGTAELVSGALTFDYTGFDADGGSSRGTVNVPVAIDKDTVTADLSGQLPVSVVSVGNVRLQLLDACGTAFDVSDFRYDLPVDPDAGPVVNIQCER